MKTAPGSIPATDDSANPAPAWLVRELHGALNWSLVIALLHVIAVFRIVVTVMQLLVALIDGSAFASAALAGGILAGVAVLGVISIWSTTRLLQWVAAVWRLREGSSSRAVEEVLRRQCRMWMALCISAICGAVSIAALFPQTVGEANKKAVQFAENQVWREKLKNMRTDMEEGDRLDDEEEKRRAAEGKKESERMKKLEEEYYREKAAREAAERNK